jgi:hypothetical protein
MVLWCPRVWSSAHPCPWAAVGVGAPHGKVRARVGDVVFRVVLRVGAVRGRGLVAVAEHVRGARDVLEIARGPVVVARLVRVQPLQAARNAASSGSTDEEEDDEDDILDAPLKVEADGLKLATSRESDNGTVWARTGAAARTSAVVFMRPSRLGTAGYGLVVVVWSRSVVDMQS